MSAHTTPVAQGATAALAEFVVDVPRRAVPDGVRTVLRAAFLDGVACGLLGLTTPEARIVQALVAEQGGPEEATLWASGGRRVSSMNAALAAGTAIHAFELDDYHRAKIHITAAVLPAVLALGERLGADGPRCLASLAAGYEVMARVSLAANPSAARMRGWHLTGTCGTFGAAAAAAVLLDLDESTTASALGLAGTQSSGLWAFNADGAMSKRLHAGLAAQSGLMAALLAQRGFHGPRQILEAEDGGFLAAMSDSPRVGQIGSELGRVWRAEGVCFKPYACCGSNHACIDAALSLQAECRFVAADVARIVASVSRVVERQTGFPYRPSTVLNAQMSLCYNIAVALTDGHALVDQFSERRISEPAVCELASRVQVEIDPEIDAVYPERYAGAVTIVLGDGRRLQRRVDFSKGTPENRMTAQDLDAKFHSLVGAAVGADEASRLFDLLTNVFDAPVITPLMRAIGALQLKGSPR